MVCYRLSNSLYDALKYFIRIFVLGCYITEVVIIINTYTIT